MRWRKVALATKVIYMLLISEPSVISCNDIVGDPGCPFIVGIKPGQRYLINKLGEVSQIPDVFYGLWFCFATLTTTG